MDLCILLVCRSGGEKNPKQFLQDLGVGLEITGNSIKNHHHFIAKQTICFHSLRVDNINLIFFIITFTVYLLNLYDNHHTIQYFLRLFKSSR